MPARTQNAIWSCVDQTHPIPASTQYESQHVLIKHFQCRLGPKSTSTCVDQASPMHARAQNACHIVLTKPILCQRRQQMHRKKCWTNTKCISTSFDQTPFMPERKHNSSQNLLTKRGLKQIPPMPARKQNASLSCVYQFYPIPAMT